MNPTKVHFPENVGFKCQTCGVCCHIQPPDVDKNERRQIENRGHKDFLAPPDETGFMWIKRKKDESCHFLTKDNKCAIYPIRPAVCKLEPYTIVDYDYESGTVELALNFPFSDCCVGVQESEATNQKDAEESALVLVQRILELTAADLELPVSDKQVHVETRSRLLRRFVELSDLQF